MKLKSLSFAGFFVVLCPLLLSQSISKISITATGDDYFGKSDISIDWKTDDPKSNRKQSLPQFDIKHPGTDEYALGWITATPSEIHIRIEVKDDIHYNNASDYDIYQGDAVQIGLDGRGDGTCGQDINTGGAFGDDDVAFTLAIGSKGTQAWKHFQGDTYPNTAMPPESISINRNEKKKITTYDFTVKWEMLGIKAGTFPQMAMAVMINDSDNEKDPQVRYSWGDGAGGRMNVGLFRRIQINNFPQDLATVDLLNDEYWDAQNPVKCLVSIKKPESLTIEAAFNGINEKKETSSTGDIERFIVSLWPVDVTKDLENLSIRVPGTDADIEIPVRVPDLAINNLVKTIDRILQDAENPLFIRHLTSLRSLTMKEWAKTKMIYSENPRLASETLGFIADMQEGFNGSASRWESYRSGEMSMIFAFISERDKSLQYYTFTLPSDWDENREYPLFVELHGAGNDNPLAGPSRHIKGKGEAADLRGYSSIRGYAREEGAGYHIEPFGRGNSRYSDIGEIDVWEAFIDVSSNFKIDKNRRYLYGFSMGGAGTSNLVVRSPHIWAAVAIYSGAGRNAETGLARNADYLPVWMWCGTRDPGYQNMRALARDYRDIGNEPVVTWAEGIAHQFLPEAQKAGVTWLQQYTRKRPYHFSYISIDDDHCGTWGIFMRRDPNLSCLPSFECNIDGNTVNLETNGNSELSINFRENGLGMKGKVKLILNGSLIYEGEDDNVYIDKHGELSTTRPSRGRFYRASIISRVLENY